VYSFSIYASCKIRGHGFIKEEKPTKKITKVPVTLGSQLVGIC
jgi:hypothetical protein